MKLTNNIHVNLKKGRNTRVFKRLQNNTKKKVVTRQGSYKEIANLEEDFFSDMSDAWTTDEVNEDEIQIKREIEDFS